MIIPAISNCLPIRIIVCLNSLPLRDVEEIYQIYIFQLLLQNDIYSTPCEIGHMCVPLNTCDDYLTVV